MRCRCHSHGSFFTRRGYEAARLYGVDKTEESRYLDKVGSVSALVEVEEDYDYDPTHIELNRRLIHGSSVHSR